jgi:hypothetical protein
MLAIKPVPKVRMRLANAAIVVIGLTLWVLPITAQTTSPQAQSPLAACGDSRTMFEVSRGEVKDRLDPPEPGKATLFVIEFYGLGDTGRVSRPLLKIGLDGQWIGAIQGITYVSASITPGEHHLCSIWQSHGDPWHNASLYNFHAEAGKRYYFRAQIDDKVYYADLQPVSDDEGRLLVSQAARSVSTPKR